MTSAPAISSPAPPAPTFATKLRLAASDIKLAHSVFALPFALLAAFIARPTNRPWPTFAAQLALIILCMVLARTWAMLVNRLADRRLDAANPRTQRRVLASGRLAARDGALIAAACAALFIAACSAFLLLFANPWPLALSLPVLAWIALYSFTKRFTAACHIFLGGALAASPLGAALAVNPPALAHTPALWLIAGMVVLWVAGFDVIYALQDIDFDRAQRLHSIPAALGWKNAIRVSRILHAGAFALLILAASPLGRVPAFGPLFFAAVGLVGLLLITEHAILARRGQSGLDMAFFTINGVVSCLLGAAGILDLTLV